MDFPGYTSFKTKHKQATSSFVIETNPKLGSQIPKDPKPLLSETLAAKWKETDKQKLGGKNGSSPRIQICPKISGLPLYILFWRWDVSTINPILRRGLDP